MKSAPYLLGIDLGTSGLKAALISAGAGRTVALALQDYKPATPRPGWAEQAPEQWTEAMVQAVRQVIEKSQARPADIAAIGLSGQMHSAVTLDAQGDPVRPAILWLDQRSTAQVERLRQEIGDPTLGQWTGNPVMPGLTLASLLWMRDEEPETWARVARVLLPKDYLRFRLTGEIHTDYSDASASGLLHPGRRAWCQELLEATGLPPSILPTLVESSSVIGVSKGEISEAMELSKGIPVVCGAGDQEAQAIGNGLLRPGPVSCTIGTGGQLLAVAPEYRPDPAQRLHTFCHVVPGRWHWLAATLTAGLSLRWLRDELLNGALDYATLADAAAEVTPGAENLIFLPHLAGERSPHMNPRARGVFFGLTLRHSWRHMARAVMEGVVFSLLDGLELIQSMGPVQRIIASGGGLRHPLWMQLQADILGRPVYRSQNPEAAALGAALLAGVGTGIYPDLETACRITVRQDPTPIEPDKELHRYYQQLAGRYRALYQALVPHFISDQAHPAEGGERQLSG